MRVNTFVSLFLSLASQVASSCDDVVSEPLSNREVIQFPKGVWLENIAVRSNGNLLVTSLTPNASLYEVAKPTRKSPTYSRHFTIDSVTSLLGITETTSDVFAIIGGSYSSTKGGIKGSYGVWTVDMSKKTPTPKLVTKIPKAVLLNGATTLPSSSHIVLIADSVLGLVWRVDTKTGKYDIAAEVSAMSSGSDSALSIGINGLHIHSGYLFWTNLEKTTFYKIKFTKDGYVAKGAKAEKVVELPVTALDDFIFGPGSDNYAWVATNSDKRIFAVETNGESIVVAGETDTDEVAGATACKFGRTRSDAKILYVTTGTESTRGGKVQAIDTTKFRWETESSAL